MATSIRTLNTIDEGWYTPSPNVVPTSTNENTLTGSYRNTDANSYFVFDLTNVKEQASAVSFKLQFDGGVAGGRTETLSFWDVTTPTEALRNITGDVAATWKDLESGIKYGATTLNVTANGIFDVVLSREAVAAYNASLGKTFAIGVSLDTATHDGDWVRFGFASKGDALSQLVVTEQKNAAPVAANDGFMIGENAATTLDVLRNDTDADKSDVLRVTSVAVKDGFGTAGIVEDGKFVFFDTGKAFDHLSLGEMATTTLGYTISDGHDGTASATASVTVLGLNDRPTDIALSNAVVAENAKGAVVGTLATADVDLRDVHSYSIAAVTNAKGETLASNPFEIANGVLKVKDGLALDHEASAGYSVAVESVDNHGASVTRTFQVAVGDDPSDNGWGPGFELTGLDDWFNPHWGGGFNASFSYKVQEADVKDGTVHAWEILPDYTGPGKIASAWMNGFDATVATGSNADGEYALHTDNQAFKQTLKAGDVLNFTLQVQGAGYERENFAFDFNDIDKTPSDLPKGAVAIDAQATNDWGSGLSQQVSIRKNGSGSLDHWQIELDVADNIAIDVSGVWGASVEKQADGDLVFTALGWNSAIGEGGTANFGFNASYKGAPALQFADADFSFVQLAAAPHADLHLV